MGILLRWKYIPDTDPLRGADVIIGMAFGANRKGGREEPGISNEQIVRIIYRLWQKKNLPIVVQREIAEAVAKLGLPVRPVLVISEADGQFHIDSYQVLRHAWAYCKKHNRSRAVIVAHPAHILRCARVAIKLGFKIRLPDVSSVPYEPRSRQWWTRNPVAYFLWEWRARIGWWLRGYM